jgi:hypothetical protein
MFVPTARTYAYASWYSVLSAGIGLSLFWLASI